jgi:hypothetical protein
MAEGINILTNTEPVIVDGAIEAIESYSRGEMSREQLYDKIMSLDVVYVDRKKFKASEE